MNNCKKLYSMLEKICTCYNYSKIIGQIGKKNSSSSLSFFLMSLNREGN
jgi:hypothetical protein